MSLFKKTNVSTYAASDYYDAEPVSTPSAVIPPEESPEKEPGTTLNLGGSGMELKVIEEYGLRDFVRAVAEDIPHRCSHCYDIRMDRTARYALEHGFPAFSTTLLVSPYQNHAGIVEAAERAAAKYGVEFLYRDFRVGFREGQAKARELEMYMQKYCGCIFSEEERYMKAKKLIP